MNNWKKRFLIVAAVFLGGCFALPIVDRVWFAFRVPTDFANVPWRGNWNSEQVPLVSGQLLVKMPDKVPIDQQFEVETLVYYCLWSPYRTGSTVRVKMIGYFAADKSGGGSNAESPAIERPHYIFKLKSGDSLSAQRIDYAATSNADMTMLIGSYRSTHPGDIGRFGLAKHSFTACCP